MVGICLVVTQLAAPAGLRSWDLKIKIKAEFANLVSAPPAHFGQLGWLHLPVSESVASVTNSEHNCAHVSTFGTIVAQKMSEKLQNEHNFINLH